jgi:hypothetical protein
MYDSAADQRACVYRITPEDVIEFVNDAWLRFAAENGTSSLAQKVLGTSLWDHISGEVVVHLSKALLGRVRESRCEATLPFRCDSPTVRRFMRMQVRPLPHRGVEFCTWVEREEPYLNRIHLLDPACPKNPEILLRACAWCKKIYAGSCWLEIEEAIDRLRLFDFASMPAITHGICEHCLQMMMTGIRPGLLGK